MGVPFQHCGSQLFGGSPSSPQQHFLPSTVCGFWCLWAAVVGQALASFFPRKWPHLHRGNSNCLLFSPDEMAQPSCLTTARLRAPQCPDLEGSKAPALRTPRPPGTSAPIYWLCAPQFLGSACLNLPALRASHSSSMHPDPPVLCAPTCPGSVHSGSLGL